MYSSGSGYVPKKVSSLEGAEDFLAGEDQLVDAILRKFQRFSRVYGFAKAELPLLEESRLYVQFYKDHPDKLAQIGLLAQSEQISVRPTLLPSVLRAYYQHKLFDLAPFHKWMYLGAVAGLDTEKGKISQDYEFGLEIFGTFSHLAEAQTIAAIWEFLQGLGLVEATLEINNIGDVACQQVYQENLGDFLSGRKLDLCDNCNRHMQNRALNVLRCGNLDCQAVVSEAPTILDFLSEESNRQFTNILEALDELEIPYQLNPLYVGPSGHSRTNFAIKYKLKDQILLIGEGGYHDNLVQNLCGKNYCAFGFAGSLLKIHAVLKELKAEVEREHVSEVFLVPLGDLAAKRSLRLFRDLTGHKIAVNDNFGHVGVKNQLKAAETAKAPIALIIGQKEAMEEMVILRDVKSGMQEIISYDKIVEEVKKRLGK